MATIKSYSVAKTRQQYGGSAVADSTVYATSKGRMNAYDVNTDTGLQEGRTATLLNGGRSAANHDVTAAAITTAGSGGPASVAVVATTTTVTGSGAGLIVSFTTNSSGAVNGTVTIKDGGESYATGDTVSVDGIAGSVLTLTAA